MKEINLSCYILGVLDIKPIEITIYASMLIRFLLAILLSNHGYVQDAEKYLTFHNCQKIFRQLKDNID